MSSNRPFSIAIVGPESTGKSSLASFLAQELNCEWVPEFAREYLKNFEGSYTSADIEAIGLGQALKEDEAKANAYDFLVLDTTPLVEKVWMEHSYGYCSASLLKEVQMRTYDLVFLTDIDLPWEPDPLREHPHLRNYFKHVYEKQLKNMGHSYHIISGLGELRFQNALKTVKQLAPLAIS